MIFKQGNIVWEKGSDLQMTVVWHEMDFGTEKVCCSYFDENKQQIIIKTRPDVLELVPDKILRKFKKRRSRSDLRSRIDSHPVIIYGSLAFVAFTTGLGFGFGIRVNWEQSTGQELVTQGTYILKENIELIIQENYVEKTLYEPLQEENKSLKDIVKRFEQSSNELIFSKITELESQKDKLKNSIPEIQARTSPLNFNHNNSQRVISYEEQSVLDKINLLSEEILILYNKIEIN